MPTVEALLAGPRGRRLCWTLLWLGLDDAARQSAAWPLAWEAVVRSGDLSRRLEEFTAVLALADPAALAGEEATVLEALGWTVNTAQYWGEPDAEDRALAAPEAVPALTPIAAAILAAPGARWWAAPADLERQRYAQFLDHRPFDEPLLSGAADRVAAWRADTVRKEESLRATDAAAPLGRCHSLRKIQIQNGFVSRAKHCRLIYRRQKSVGVHWNTGLLRAVRIRHHNIGGQIFRFRS